MGSCKQVQVCTLEDNSAHLTRTAFSVQAMVTQQIGRGLDEINEAFQRMERGEDARTVIVYG